MAAKRPRLPPRLFFTAGPPRPFRESAPPGGLSGAGAEAWGGAGTALSPLGWPRGPASTWWASVHPARSSLRLVGLPWVQDAREPSILSFSSGAFWLGNQCAGLSGSRRPPRSWTMRGSRGLLRAWRIWESPSVPEEGPPQSQSQPGPRWRSLPKNLLVC